MGSHESWGGSDMLRGFDEVQGFTHDLGTEAKIVYFQLNRSRLLLCLPLWLAGRRGKPPQVMQVKLADRAGDKDVYANPLVQCSGD